MKMYHLREHHCPFTFHAGDSALGIAYGVRSLIVRKGGVKLGAHVPYGPEYHVTWQHLHLRGSHRLVAR